MKKLLPVLLLLAACQTSEKTSTALVDQSTLSRHIERLSSDEFLGRMPFSQGEEITINYLKEEFEKLGLEPGNGDSYYQQVPLIEINGQASETMTVKAAGAEMDFTLLEDFVAYTQKPVEEVALEESEMVFAGYGIVAPEYGWNDYEGIDWTGKTAVVLVNDPGFATQDSSLFKGNTMTYYGRWTYKYEEAGRQGAAGLIIIHETAPAGYGWNVIQAGFVGAQMNLESNTPRADIQGWVSTDAAQKLFEASTLENKNYQELALSEGFTPIPMGLTASVSIKNTIKKDVSNNVVAVLPGTDLKDEHIIYSAHWDHFGVGKAINGDSIYNGAVDNATGTALLLAIAEAMKKGETQRRSVMFLAVTAEEQGLLGSAYYSENPIVDPAKTVANINVDALYCPDKMKDLTIIGYGQSELDDYATKVAEKYGRYIIPDTESEKGYFFRSDHFNFAKIGIPALYADGSYEGFTLSAEEVKKIKDAYRSDHYHQPSDGFELIKDNMEGMTFDAQLLFEVGAALANEDYFPKWKEGSEFKAIREVSRSEKK